MQTFKFDQEMKFSFFIIVASVISGCASSGVVQTGPGSYTIAKSEWGFTSGAVHAARLTQEASEYCATLGKVVNVTSVEKNDAQLGKTPAAAVSFQCVDK
jgi:hypothetical protein